MDYTELNNLLIVDPNPCGNEKIEIEDLNITVELEVYNRDNEILIFNDNTFDKKDSKNKYTRVSFIDTSKDEEKTNLTTKYTELNTTFRDDDDLEGLGIESIDINFNTSYAPMIKIKFKDIRGKLFEMGNDSPYAFLFELP